MILKMERINAPPIFFQPHDDATINNDLAVSDSDDEAARQVDHQQMENPPQEEEDDKDALWF